MARIYSSVIFAGHNIGLAEITLDPTYTWVMRDIEVFWPGPSTGSSVQLLDVATGATLYAVQEADIGPAGFWTQWRGRVVLVPQPGEVTLAVVGNGIGGNPDVRISGYKLGV